MEPKMENPYANRFWRKSWDEGLTDLDPSIWEISYTEAIRNTFDWGAQMIDVSDIITATITKVNGTNVSIKLHPIINIVFTMPPFNWTARIIDNTDSSFILRIETYVGFETQIDLGYGLLNMIVTDIDNKAITLGINTESPDIKFIDQVLVYEIEVINVHTTT